MGRKWLENFLQRWKGELKVTQEYNIEGYRRRLNGFTEDVRCGWFKTLANVLKASNLTKRLHATYNCDEASCKYDNHST